MNLVDLQDREGTSYLHIPRPGRRAASVTLHRRRIWGA